MKTLDTIFKSVPYDDWSEIEEEQACIVVSEFWEVLQDIMREQNRMMRNQNPLIYRRVMS